MRRGIDRDNRIFTDSKKESLDGWILISSNELVRFVFSQVMAIATLALCYNNGEVFEGVVKIRKGLAVTLMLEATSMDSV